MFSQCIFYVKHAFHMFSVWKVQVRLRVAGSPLRFLEILKILKILEIWKILKILGILEILKILKILKIRGRI